MLFVRMTLIGDIFWLYNRICIFPAREMYVGESSWLPV